MSMENHLAQEVDANGVLTSGSTHPVNVPMNTNETMSSSHSHSENCSGVHIGASCLPRGDVRGAIVALTSRMLDNPDKYGIYGTTRFYDALEQYVNAELALREQEIVGKIERRLGLPMEPYTYEQKTNPTKQKQREAYNDCHKKVIDILTTITKKE